MLIAGHHGASKASSFALLKHIKPDYIVFSAGYLNKFGHPAEAVLERVSEFESKTLDTASLGGIRFKSFVNSKGQSELTVNTVR